MDFLAIPTLTGALVTLEPLALKHAAELAEAVQDGQLHQLWYTRVPAPEKMREDIEGRLAQHAAGLVVPWVIRRSDGRAVGVTTFLNIRADHRRLEIGSTWIAHPPRAPGSTPR